MVVWKYFVGNLSAMASKKNKYTVWLEPIELYVIRCDLHVHVYEFRWLVSWMVVSAVFH